jgi:hypothetical protein
MLEIRRSVSEFASSSAGSESANDPGGPFNVGCEFKV